MGFLRPFGICLLATTIIAHQQHKHDSPVCLEAHAELVMAQIAVRELEAQLEQVLLALSNSTAALTVRQLAVDECARAGPLGPTRAEPTRGVRRFPERARNCDPGRRG